VPVPIELLAFARQLRQSQTDAETLLWFLLRERRFCGFKFRRQYPIGGYILDFYCHAGRLAIELDGGGHNTEDQCLYDAERTKILRGAGIRVRRFWNNDVLNSLDTVLAEIHACLTSAEIKN
jgi:very-short-patch-repair endonuclease